MSSALQILTTRNFNGLSFDCYHEDGQDVGDFWATSEQIGQLLGYKRPANAITKIHKQNKARLDKFSTNAVMAQVEGNRTVTRDVTVYNFKGLLEICRYSQQPKANAVIDWLWEIADELRRTGMIAQRNEIKRLSSEVDELHKKIDEMYPFQVLGAMVLAQKGSMTFQGAAQLLSQHGIETGQNRLFQYCRYKKLLCSRKGKQWNKPTQKAIDKGLLNLEISGGFNAITVVTPEGMKYLANELGSEQYPLLMLIAHKD